MEGYADPGTQAIMAAIVALTVPTVEALKRGLATVPVLEGLPTALYAVLVSIGYTAGARALQLLDGDWKALAAQAVLQALVAFGVLTYPTWTKAVGDSKASGRHLGVLLAVGLAVSSAGCASALMQANRSVHAAISVVQDSAELYCRTTPEEIAKLPATTQQACRAFFTRLDLVIDAADRFAAASARDSYAEVPAIVVALANLEKESRALFTDEAVLAEVERRVGEARRLLDALKGKEEER